MLHSCSFSFNPTTEVSEMNLEEMVISNHNIVFLCFFLFTFFIQLHYIQRQALVFLYFAVSVSIINYGILCI